MAARTEAMDMDTDQGPNQNCQRKLAKTLVAKLGHAGAVQACRANQWEGVLLYVLELGEGEGAEESLAFD